MYISWKVKSKTIKTKVGCSRSPTSLGTNTVTCDFKLAYRGINLTSLQHRQAGSRECLLLHDCVFCLLSVKSGEFFILLYTLTSFLKKIHIGWIFAGPFPGISISVWYFTLYKLTFSWIVKTSRDIWLTGLHIGNAYTPGTGKAGKYLNILENKIGTWLYWKFGKYGYFSGVYLKIIKKYLNILDFSFQDKININ